MNYIEKILATGRSLVRVQVWKVLCHAGILTNHLDDFVGRELIKMRNINEADLFILEDLLYNQIFISSSTVHPLVDESGVVFCQLTFFFAVSISLMKSIGHSEIGGR